MNWVQFSLVDNRDTLKSENKGVGVRCFEKRGEEIQSLDQLLCAFINLHMQSSLCGGSRSDLTLTL